MAAIFRIGLFLFLAIEVSAQFEYTANVQNTLPEYTTLLRNGAKILKAELVNPTAKVFFKRFEKAGSGMYFYVDDEMTSASEHKDTPKGSICKGLPGITPSPSRSSVFNSIQDCVMPTTVYCLAEMHFESFQTTDGTSHMRLNLIFNNAKKKRNIGIMMNPFKPPLTQSDKTHAENNFVMHVFPIPPENFLWLKHSFQFPDIKVHFFDSTVSWMENIVQRAVRAESINTGHMEPKTEWYLVGPVIMPEDTYDTIVFLWDLLTKLA